MKKIPIVAALAVLVVALSGCVGMLEKLAYKARAPQYKAVKNIVVDVVVQVITKEMRTANERAGHRVVERREALETMSFVALPPPPPLSTSVVSKEVLLALVLLQDEVRNHGDIPSALLLFEEELFKSRSPTTALPPPASAVAASIVRSRELASQWLLEAEVDKESTIPVADGEEVIIVRIDNKLTLLRIAATVPRVRTIATVYATFKIQNADEITGLFYADGTQFHSYLHVTDANLR